jgi:hypothetical protein
MRSGPLREPQVGCPLAHTLSERPERRNGDGAASFPPLQGREWAVLRIWDGTGLQGWR